MGKTKNWWNSSLKYVKKNWNIIVASTSVIICGLIYSVPQLKKPEYYPLLAMLFANAILWTVVDIKILLVDKEKEPNKFNSLFNAQNNIYTSIIEELKKNKRNRLDISVLGGKIQVISDVLYRILDNIENGDISTQNIRFNIYCINPEFINSVSFQDKFDNDFSEAQFNQSKQLLKESISEFEHRIDKFNNSNLFKNNNVSVSINKYNSYPSFYAFTIGSNHIYIGSFTWREDVKEFSGANNPCYYFKPKDEEFNDFFKIIQSEISFFKDSEHLSINMMKFNDLLDIRQVNKINLLAFDSIVNDYKNQTKAYQTYKLPNSQINQIEELINIFLDYLDKSQLPKNVLDIGAGTGYTSHLISRKKYDVTAIDISKRMTETIKRQFAQIKVINDDYISHEFNKKFSHIVAISFIHLFPSIHTKRILDKMYHDLEEGGYLYVSTSNNSTVTEGYFRKDNCSDFHVRYRRFFSKNELEKAILKSNFKIVHSYTKNDILYSDKQWIAIVAQK